MDYKSKQKWYKQIEERIKMQYSKGLRPLEELEMLLLVISPLAMI